MRIRILGCSGGIGLGQRTSAMLLDDDILIDAGTGVGDLSIREFEAINSVFLTHSHLDHIVSLPLFLDSVFEARSGRPVQVYALQETIDALRKHIFNDIVWPNFEVLPTPNQRVLNFQPIVAGDVLTLGQRSIRAVDVFHSVPALGFCFEGGNKVFAFSGDTQTNNHLWPVLNNYPTLDALIVEVSFSNAYKELAITSGHYCPETLAVDIAKLKHQPDIWVTAMKPGLEEEIFAQVVEAIPNRVIRRLKRGDVFNL